MSGAGKAVIGFLVGRPLVAIALALVVVGALLLGTHRQRTPVTNRVEHVKLTDQQQIQLGDQEYAKTLRQNRARIISSGPKNAEVQRVANRIEGVAGQGQAELRLEGDAAPKERGERILPPRRKDRRLHRHPADHGERRWPRDGARTRGRRTRRPSTWRSGSRSGTSPRSPPRSSRAASRSRPGQFVRSRRYWESTRACASAAPRSPRRITSD